MTDCTTPWVGTIPEATSWSNSIASEGNTYVGLSAIGNSWTDPACIPNPLELVPWTFIDGSTPWEQINEELWTLI